MHTKKDILTQLRREIIALEGYKPAPAGMMQKVGLGPILQAFPDHTFPISAIHEFICSDAANKAASIGFVSGLLSSLVHKGRAMLWINPSPVIFPPALKAYGITPEHIFFLHLAKEKEVLWTLEEALRCSTLTAVVAEVGDISFTSSRRLQLAVEESGVTCFMLRKGMRNITSVCAARWHITSLPSYLEQGLPGVGHPRFRVELLKVRNGKQGCWELEWKENRFQHVSKLAALSVSLQRKAV